MIASVKKLILVFFLISITCLAGCSRSSVVIVIETGSATYTTDFEPGFFTSKVVERALKGCLMKPGEKISVFVERRTASILAKTKVVPTKRVKYTVMPSNGFGSKVYRFFENDVQGDCVTNNDPAELAMEIEREFTSLLDVVGP